MIILLLVAAPRHTPRVPPNVIIFVLSTAAWEASNLADHGFRSLPGQCGKWLPPAGPTAFDSNGFYSICLIVLKCVVTKQSTRPSLVFIFVSSRPKQVQHIVGLQYSREKKKKKRKQQKSLHSSGHRGIMICFQDMLVQIGQHLVSSKIRSISALPLWCLNRRIIADIVEE